MDDFKIIEDQLNYEMFLAEESLKVELASLDRKARLLTEAAELEIIHEAMQDVIRKYMGKITEAIQRAWNNLKAKMNQNEIDGLLTKENLALIQTKKLDMKLPLEFEYPELNAWNTLNEDISIDKALLAGSNYAQFKPYLETPEKFLQEYFPMAVEGGKKPSEVFNNKCFSTAGENQIVNNTLAGEYRDFLLNFKNSIQLIQDDIESINQVNQHVGDMLKDIGAMSSNTTVPETNKNVNKESYSYFREDQTTPQKSNNLGNGTTTNNTANKPEDKTKFRNADPNAPAPKQENDADRKNIINYYKAMTSLLSAKMRTCNKIRSNSMKIIRNYIKLLGGNTNIIRAPKINKQEKK